MAKKLTSFQITARLVMIVSVDVRASSYEEALAESKTMREVDFVKPLGEFIDGSMRIAQIAESGFWRLDD